MERPLVSCVGDLSESSGFSVDMYVYICIYVYKHTQRYRFVYMYMITYRTIYIYRYVHTYYLHFQRACCLCSVATPGDTSFGGAGRLSSE